MNKYKCPNCGATDLEEDLEVNEVGGPYVCPNCIEPGMELYNPKYSKDEEGNLQNDSFEMKYLKAGELKRILEQVPNTASVYYARIEDEYFDKNGWVPVKLKADAWYDRVGIENTRLEIVDPEDDTKDEEADWIEAYEVWYNEEENAVKITAHY